MDNELHILTRNEIIDKLKSMKVGEDGCLPMKAFSFIVKNREYDPDSFSQEVEDSEERIDVWKEVYKEIQKPEFDFVWNNTIGSLPRNSKEWNDNHTKVCTVKLCPMVFYAACINHSDGTRDYYSEELVDKILNWSKENGEIVDLS
jgi:hypothetical protein